MTSPPSTGSDPGIATSALPHEADVAIPGSFGGGAIGGARAGTVDPVRRLLSPGWVTLHVVVVLGTATMLWLGFWQWTGGFSGHTAKNTGYALQWWVFAVFAIYFWVKVMRDALRGGSPASAPAASARSPLGGLRRAAAPAPAGMREYRMASAPVVADDSDLGRYNAYLASLEAPAPDASPADASPADGSSAGSRSADGSSAGARSADGSSAGARSASASSAGARSADGSSLGSRSADAASAGAPPPESPDLSTRSGPSAKETA